MPKRAKRAPIAKVHELSGYGARIRQAILDHASQLERRYPDVEFARDVGKAERGKPYGSSTLADWIAERNEPRLKTFRAMAKVTGKSVSWLMAVDEPAARGKRIVDPRTNGGDAGEEEA